MNTWNFSSQTAEQLDRWESDLNSWLEEAVKLGDKRDARNCRTGLDSLARERTLRAQRAAQREMPMYEVNGRPSSAFTDGANAR